MRDVGRAANYGLSFIELNALTRQNGLDLSPESVTPPFPIRIIRRRVHFTFHFTYVRGSLRTTW